MADCIDSSFSLALPTEARELSESSRILEATTEKRGSLEVVRDYRKIMDTVRNSGIIIKRILNIRKILCLWMHVIWLFS